jgi:hypothetical protein
MFGSWLTSSQFDKAELDGLIHFKQKKLHKYYMKQGTFEKNEFILKYIRRYTKPTNIRYICLFGLDIDEYI